MCQMTNGKFDAKSSGGIADQDCDMFRRVDYRLCINSLNIK